MKINWQNNIFNYRDESVQDVMGRINTNAVSRGFTIKMSSENFNIIKNEVTNAKFMTGLPVNDIITVLVLHVGNELLNEDVIRI